MRLLIIEDDKPLAEFIGGLLESAEYQLHIATDAEEGARLALEEDCDALLLDVSRAPMQGLATLAAVRAHKPGLPVLVCGSGPVEERVKALDLGADDYLAKPFACDELKARVRVLMRHRRPEPVLRVRDLELNRLTRSVVRAGRSIHLSSREFCLLELLMEHAGSAVKREEIIERVWSAKPQTHTNVIEVYVNYLRKKVDEGFEPRLIRTVRGIGYLLR